MQKKELLDVKVEHIDIKTFDAIPIVEQYKKMAFQARNLARAATIYTTMLEDTKCSTILCLAGSLFSAGLKKVVLDMIENNMVDAIVSTGANIVDQDFFEGLGFNHYQGSPFANDDALLKQHIDRIYDTYIDEDELRECDMTIAKICDSLKPRPYSSREFIEAMGKYLVDNNFESESIVKLAYQKNVPIFVPAFSDCSAGFGLIYHQWHRQGKEMVTIDSAKDFLELTKIKIEAKTTGLFMVGGGVPKNFAQDITVAAEIIGEEVDMHKYAIQITVADERDGALSGSTLKEAHSWGKVHDDFEQMVFSEATIALPLIASYAYHKKSWENRQPKNYNLLLNK
ncbi:MAG: deoxyhypusine synthase [Gammaproteobacteria bacterium]|nr:deoxyhypusine synthase [Gammaproteobacteria bacterium]